MKTIRDAAAAQISCLGKQKINSNTEYRKLNYTTEIRNEDGLLLYNNLTDELLLLNSQDEIDIQEKNLNSTVFISISSL